ncbi:hypothetical protein BKI52_02595 [marine bacterium AO1-C]|nr:hypothetical protein BKI52_02595 [marine bacterium AO1-C]
MNTKAKQIIEKNLQEKNPVLDLGNCGLKGNEEELNLLVRCNHIDVLVFSSEWYEWDIEKQAWANHISVNNSIGNKLSHLPENLPNGLKKLILSGCLNFQLETLDLTLLNQLLELREIDLSDNQITDLSPLNQLPQLTKISLSANQITDLSPLQQLPQLREIDLNDNQITDLSPLNQLLELREIDLNDNQITDLSPLNQLPQLTKISLNDNQITDLSPLNQLPQLREIYLSYNQITDLSPLNQLPQLTKISLSANQITDLSPLNQLPQLREIYLNDNQITDLSPLNQLPELREIYLSDNQITDLSPLNQLLELREINLSYNQITDLSPLQQLPQLREIYLSANQITDLSPLQQLPQLTKISLSYNQITDLSPLNQLPKLREIDLSDNQITDLSPLNQLPQLREIDLSDNQITDLSPLNQLPELREIDLSDNQITDLSPLNQLPKLREIDLSDNQITDLSPLQQLPELREIYLSNNQITDLSPLNQLPQLREIYLSNNQITDLSPLNQLPKLRLIYLSNNQITDLSPLNQLPQLREIDLSNNQITDLSPLNQLPQLTKISLSNNQITDLSPLNQLPQLTKISLSYNQITDLSPLNQLPQLRLIYLSDNQITDLSPLNQLPQLRLIYLSANQITDLSPLNQLPKLRQIYLRDNQITDLSPLNQLPKLREIDLSSNQINSIYEKNLQAFFRLRILTLNNNPIKNIPEDIFNHTRNCLEDILHYFDDLKKGKIKAYQTKIILIGNGRVGKTSLVKRWLDDKFNSQEPSTHAIQLRQVPSDKVAQDKSLQKVLLNVWDFGGQDIYHATHRLFMQTQAIFILVWDVETEERKIQRGILKNGEEVSYHNFKLPYWLDYAHILGKQSPVLVVQSKKAIHQKKLPDNWNDLQNKYNIEDWLATDSSVDDWEENGFDNFVFQLERCIKREINKACTDLPSAWWAVKEAIGKLGAKTLSIPDFQQICDKQGIPVENQITLRRYLHNIGFFFYHSGLFHDQIILDQKWVIEKVYTLFDRDGLFLKYREHGFFKGEDLQNLAWNKNSLEEKQLFLSFMESCQICVEINKSPSFQEKEFATKEYLIPQLLPNEPIAHLNHIFPDRGDGLYIKTYHPFLHVAVFQQLLIRLIKLTNKGSVKKYCAIFEQDGQLALVNVFPSERSILIQVTNEYGLGLMQRIHQEIEKTQVNIEGLKSSVSINGKDYVLIDELQTHDKSVQHIKAQNGEYCVYNDLKVFLKDHHPKQLLIEECLQYLQEKNIEAYFDTITPLVSEKYLSLFSRLQEKFNRKQININELEKFAQTVKRDLKNYL